jgi:hypothetical protein
MEDTPTNNFAVLNPLQSVGATAVLSSGNLIVSTGTTGQLGKPSSMVMDYAAGGKWYCEVTQTAGTEAYIGVKGFPYSADNVLGNLGSEFAYLHTGQKRSSGTSSAYGAAYTTGDVIGVALDQDTYEITFYKNGVSQGVAYSGFSGDFVFIASDGSTASGLTYSFNFGQRPFTYTPPTGFKALCTKNLPAVTIANPKKHFDVVLHSGNSGANTITGSSFQPDLVWIKRRNAAYSNALFDSVRGVTNRLFSDSTSAEIGGDGLGVDSFDANGFTVNDNSNLWNITGGTYVDWLWKAGGAAVSNTAGTITSTVSANTTAGFSIVTYTGTGANATVGHGLGVAPKLVIAKDRDTAVNWVVYHGSLGGTDFLRLNTTDAKVGPDATIYNGAPTSTVINIGSGSGINGSTKKMVMYVFAEIPGFSKIGSYTGNGSADGPFVYCGFRPRYVLLKNVGTTSNWQIHDTARAEYNASDARLFANLSDAELTTALGFDILSNGFKVRSTTLTYNGSGNAIVFAAFAEYPFGGSNVSPSPAR